MMGLLWCIFTMTILHFPDKRERCTCNFCGNKILTVGGPVVIFQNKAKNVAICGICVRILNSMIKDK